MKKEIKKGFKKVVKKWNRHKEKVFDTIDSINKTNEEIFGKPRQDRNKDFFAVDPRDSGSEINFDPFASPKKRRSK